MRFDKFIPTDRLKPYIRYLVVSENKAENIYKVFPSTSLVVGFQYQGRLATITVDKETKLATTGRGAFQIISKYSKIQMTQERYWSILLKLV